MASLTVLLLFLVVGLLDSLHYRPYLPPAPDAQVTNGRGPVSTEVRSALDALAEPLRTRVEKTYSAPLAYTLFAKQTIEKADGTQQRAFPRLKFGGAGLQYPEEDHAGDVLGRVGLGLALAALRWLPMVDRCPRPLAVGKL